MNDKIKELKSFDPASYEKVDIDKPVIFTTIALEKLGIELSLENIIVGAFKLFAMKFCLSGYPEFPDATRVEKSLWRCKGKKRQWIAGKTAHGYLVTDVTKLIATQTEAQLSNPILIKKKIPSRMR